MSQPRRSMSGCSRRTVEQIVDIRVSQSLDEIVEVIMFTPQART